MHVIVVGAGVVGVTTAWYLVQAGFEVTVFEARSAAGLETSFANGGQISISHPEPWANPGAPLQILRWLGRPDAPMRFRPRADSAQWRWALAFLNECRPSRTRSNTEAIARLAAYSLECLRALRQSVALEYDQEARGILHLFYTPAELNKGQRNAELLNRYGIPARILDPAESVTLEPALAHVAPRLVGAMHGMADESGDAHRFAQALARHCADAGVEFRFDTRVESVDIYGGAAKGVVVRDPDGRIGVERADRIVVCAGVATRRLAARWGEDLPIYPVKGYSVSLPILDPSKAPLVSLTDEHRRIVCSRLGDRLRVAGTAELVGYDLAPNPARSDSLVKWIEEMFPSVGDSGRVERWAGLRPATPSNRPLIGKTRIKNVYLNSGHGTLGWTLCCGSAATLIHSLC